MIKIPGIRVLHEHKAYVWVGPAPGGITIHDAVAYTGDVMPGPVGRAENDGMTYRFLGFAIQDFKPGACGWIVVSGYSDFNDSTDYAMLVTMLEAEAAEDGPNVRFSYMVKSPAFKFRDPP
jgi:hypothetical protein